MFTFEPVSFSDVHIYDGFWANRMKCNEEVTVYAVRDRFKETGRFEAFKFNWREGSSVPKPHYFWDSDVAKWIESVAFILTNKQNDELKADVEELIDLIEKNQCNDGYFNIYHTVVAPELRFKNRDNHELYCLGHLIEAAVAYYNATKSERLLDITDKYIDLVINVFCVEKSAEFVTPGHEEIELALIKLFRLRKNKKYLELALFFLNERGKQEEQTASWYNTSYNQGHVPVRNQTDARGHCVRACYLYSAMADAVKETGDEQLLNACKSLFDDIVTKKMYISGGIGSSHHGEAFTLAYDLPNDTAYSETCAAISLMMFADRMKDIDFDSKYADIVEREIYNGIISGVSLDGKAFFYENPLEINLSDRNKHISVLNAGEHFPITQRQEVFGCSCCPPNLTRFTASIADHIFSYRDDAFCIHQFMSCDTEINGVKIKMSTNYPADGNIKIGVTGASGKKLYIRIPSWCKEYSINSEYTVYNGYAVVDIKDENIELDISFNMEVRFFAASPFVRADSGKIAVMYGPVLYCMESTDNKFNHSEIALLTDSEAKVLFSDYFDCNIIEIKAKRVIGKNALYYDISDMETEDISVTLIPYYGFANRGESNMAVWLNRY